MMSVIQRGLRAPSAFRHRKREGTSMLRTGAASFCSPVHGARLPGTAQGQVRDPVALRSDPPVQAPPGPRKCASVPVGATGRAWRRRTLPA